MQCFISPLVALQENETLATTFSHRLQLTPCVRGTLLTKRDCPNQTILLVIMERICTLHGPEL